MTLKRLMILLGILVLLAGVGIMWLWQYAYTPQGRARVIIAQLKNDDSLRAIMLRHHVVRRGFSDPNDEDIGRNPTLEMAKLGHEVLPIVIEALQDDSPDVRSVAIRVCGELRDPAAIEPLAQCLRDENRAMNRHHDAPDHFFQLDCMYSLIEIGPAAYGPLIRATTDCTIREEIPEMLAQKWGTGAVPYLMELLEDSGSVFDSESYRHMRYNAARALGELKDKRATDALLRHLKDGNSQVGEAAASALGDIGDPRAIPGLLKTLHDKDCADRIRIPAAGSLARMGRNEGIEYLVGLIKSVDNRDERRDAINELGNTQSKAAFAPLLSLMSNSDSGVRSDAADAMVMLHDPRAIPAVRELLNSPDSGVREDAATALKELGVKPPPALQPGKP
jgi:HEAT repeat protein